MESLRAPMKFVIERVLVERVEERFHREYQHGIGKDAVFKNISLGWFLVLRGSHEAIYVGNESPKILGGDSVQITIEKVS